MKEDNPIKNIYSLAPMQKGMLYHYLMDKSTNEYIEQMCIDLKYRQLDTEIFEKTVNKIIERHDALRTVFIYDNVDHPMQVVLAEKSIAVAFRDLSQFQEKEKQQYISEYRNRDIEQGFDLSSDALLRVGLFKSGTENYKIIWTFHHIIMDGWCLDTIFTEFIHIYKALKDNTSIQLKTAPEYHEYIKWIQEKPYTEDLNFWQEYLKDYSNTAVIPGTGQKQKKNCGRKEYTFAFTEDSTDSIEQTARKYRVTISNIVHGIWGILLQKYNNTGDIVFGSVTSGRSSDIDGIEKTIGLFINTVPCRVKCDHNTALIDVITEIRNDFSRTDRVSYIGLWDIQKHSSLGTGLIDNILVLENYGFDEHENSLKSDSFEILNIEATEVTNYNMDANVYLDNCLRVKINYNADVYDTVFLNNMERHIRKITDLLLENPEIRIRDIDIVSQEEKEILFGQFNGKKADIPENKTVHRLFEEQVLKNPQKTAVKCDDEKWTYEKLNEKAEWVARWVRDKNITDNDTVGILLERSPLMAACILGIWKAGAAYIPLDTAYPVERLAGILEDSETRLLVTETVYTSPELEEKYAGEIMRLDIINDLLPENGNEPQVPEAGPGNLAYVIYTSGSTGKPKGAMVEHGGMLNHMMSKINLMGLGAGSIIGQNASQCFDISVWQFFAALICGGTTVIYNNEAVMNPLELTGTIINDKVTVLELVPSYLDAVLDCLEESRQILSTLEYLIVTGEEVKSNLVKKWFKLCPGIILVNAYGPTEASDDITHYVMKNCPDTDKIPIGRPVQNLNIYIVDDYMNLCPVGIKGEITVSGIGVGRGYLNDPEKTGQVFMDNPFVNTGSQRLYKTGDLGRWLPDGNIEFSGRKDFQVKIRGFRIELGEIENRLLQYEGIKQAIVIDRQDTGGNKQLCAFIISEDELPSDELKEYLGKTLPDYMIPHYFIKLDSMPLTPNGKIDRNRLNNYAIDYQDHAVCEEPQTRVEKLLVDVWGKTFGRDYVGLNDNFFAIGGDSIKAIQVTSRLMKHGLKLKVPDLLKNPTIKQCMKYIKTSGEAIEQKTVQGQVELTAVQKKYFLEEHRTSNHYNQSILLSCRSRINRKLMEEAFTAIIVHHDALRMQYEYFNNSFMQYNPGTDDLNFRLEVHDLCNSSNYREDILELTRNIQKSITLQNTLLIKAALFRIPDEDCLFIAVHHLIIDGISWRILLEDLETAYSQLLNNEPVELPPKTHSFKHWAKHLVIYANGREIMKEVPYWNELEKKQVSCLPVDHKTDCRSACDSESEESTLSGDYTQKLFKNTNAAFNTEINDILLTALARTISHWTGDSRTLIHLEGHGREYLDNDINISRTTGWFTSIYPVILDLSTGNDMASQICTIKESLRAVPNKGVGYGLLKYLRDRADTADLNFNLKPQITFNYIGQFDNIFSSPVFDKSGLATFRDRGDDIQSDSELVIESYVNEDMFKVLIKYSKHEFNKGTIEKLSEEYIKELEKIIDFCCSFDKTNFTPADFDHGKLSQEDVNDILDYIDDMEFAE